MTTPSLTHSTAVRPRRVHARYDPASKVWAQICAGMIALIINWFSVVIPQIAEPPRNISWAWWAIATAIAVLPALGWTVGHIARKDKEGIIMWGLPLLLMICTQLVFIKWSSIN